MTSLLLAWLSTYERLQISLVPSFLSFPPDKHVSRIEKKKVEENNSKQTESNKVNTVEIHFHSVRNYFRKNLRLRKRNIKYFFGDEPMFSREIFRISPATKFVLLLTRRTFLMIAALIGFFVWSSRQKGKEQRWESEIKYIRWTIRGKFRWITFIGRIVIAFGLGKFLFCALFESRIIDEIHFRG